MCWGRDFLKQCFHLANIYQAPALALEMLCVSILILTIRTPRGEESPGEKNSSLSQQRQTDGGCGVLGMCTSSLQHVHLISPGCQRETRLTIHRRRERDDKRLDWQGVGA